MNHPHELLAEYVDGALPEGERAVVDAHLRDCQECRAEIGSAGSARGALAALTDGPVPAGLGAAAIAEASGADPTQRETPRWYRMSGVAAAAVIVVLLAVALPRLASQDDNASPEAAAGAADAASATPSLAIEAEETNYSSERLLELVSSERSSESLTSTQTDEFAAADSGEVLDCLHTALPGLKGEPVQLIRARFEGTASYIGVFEAGPGDGSPARAALAASVRGCRLLSYASDS
jgi:hypothetical protein